MSSLLAARGRGRGGVKAGRNTWSLALVTTVTTVTERRRKLRRWWLVMVLPVWTLHSALEPCPLN